MPEELLPRPISDAGELYLHLNEVLHFNGVAKMGLTYGEIEHLHAALESIWKRVDETDRERCNALIRQVVDRRRQGEDGHSSQAR